MGIEPTRPAWKAGILPLNYTRMRQRLIILSKFLKDVNYFARTFPFFLQFFPFLFSVVQLHPTSASNLVPLHNRIATGQILSCLLFVPKREKVVSFSLFGADDRICAFSGAPQLTAHRAVKFAANSSVFKQFVRKPLAPARASTLKSRRVFAKHTNSSIRKSDRAVCGRGDGI